MEDQENIILTKDIILFPILYRPSETTTSSLHITSSRTNSRRRKIKIIEPRQLEFNKKIYEDFRQESMIIHQNFSILDLRETIQQNKEVFNLYNRRRTITFSKCFLFL